MKKNFSNPSPEAYLSQVADHCPRAVSTYMKLWKKVDLENQLEINKNQVKLEFLTSLAKFKNDLLMLVREGLVSIEETQDTFYIELVDWETEIDAEGYPLC